MNDKDIDRIAEKIYATILTHNRDKSNREVQISPDYRHSKGKFYVFSAIWFDNIGSSHAIGAIINNDLSVATFVGHRGNKIKVSTEELPLKFKQALAEIPKKTI